MLPGWHVLVAVKRAPWSRWRCEVCGRWFRYKTRRPTCRGTPLNSANGNKQGLNASRPKQRIKSLPA
jgi:transposase-like protein